MSEVGTQFDMQRYLGVESDDMLDQIKVQKVQHITSFFGGFSDGVSVLRSICVKIPKGQRLEKVYEYTRMRAEYEKENGEVEKGLGEFEERKRKLQSLKRDVESLE